MTSRSNSIESEALSLPIQQRARLVVRLLDSIEQRSPRNPDEVQRAWLEEADRRYEAYLRGKEEAISAEQCFDELRAEDR